MGRNEPPVLRVGTDWNNIKINFGTVYSEYKTVWNHIRRSHAIDVTYNFYGSKKTVNDFNQVVTISPRVVRTVKIANGILQVSTTPFEGHNINNNMPSLSYTVNSDGTFLVSKTVFAHEMYPSASGFWGMDAYGANMLVQPAGKISYSIDPPGNIEWETANNTTLLPSENPFTYSLLTTNQRNDLSKGDRIYITIPMVLSANSGTDEISVDLSCNGSWVDNEEVTLKDGDYSVCNFNYTVWEDAVNSLELTISGIDLQTTLHSIRCEVIKSVIISDVTSDYADRVVSASAVTWERQTPLGSGSYSYRQKDQWVWNVPLESTTGLPQEIFQEFDYTDPESNTAHNWEKKSTVDKYSSFSKPVQVTAAGQPVKTVIYGKNEHIPIAKVANATFRECGIFTGDYQCRSDADNYWDKENGWEKGVDNPPTLETSDLHFGQKSIIAENDYAARRNVLIIPGRSYTMSAWVKMTSGTITMKADIGYLSDSSSTWPLDPNALTLVQAPAFMHTFTNNNSIRWYLLTVEIPSTFTNSLDENRDWYARVWIGGHPGSSSFKAAIDDIRFVPTDAMVSSTYYDTLWRKPLLSVDANNNPGVKTVYDEYGRPVEFFRFSDAGDPSSLQKLQSKEYHLMGDGDVPAAYINGYETGTPDWSDKDGCGIRAVITRGGRSGAYRLVVDKAAGCIAYKTLDTPQVPSFENKMCVYRGF